MVVDDAIVIADNYIELLDEGVPRPEAAWRSASELAIPVLTATLTIICSFLPFLILSGATGEFIRALPLTVAIALSTSFLVGMLLTPMLSQFFIKQGLHTHEAATQKKRRSPLELMQSIYNRVIVVAMGWKTAAVALGIFAIAAGAFVLHRLPERFFPFAERDQFVVDVWLPEGWKVEATQAAVARIEDVLRHEKEVVNYTSFIGSSFPRFYYNVNPQLPDKNYAQLLVSTESAEVTPKLVRELRPRLAAGGAGSPRLPERVATGSGPVGAHRNPAFRRRRARAAVLGRSRTATGRSARQVRSTYTATGARMHTG